MNSEIKIPTILGLAVLTIGMGTGIFLVNQDQILKSRASQTMLPKNLTVVNVSGNSASIYWQTDQVTTGFVQAGPLPSLGLTFRDDRDSKAPQPHLLHFITLTNLTPNTTYYYKVTSGSTTYPEGNPLSFKTTNTTFDSPYQPIIGTVIDANFQPITEGLITMEIPGAQPLATVTKMAGNFVLPLALLANKELSEKFILTEGTNATLTIFDQQRSSRVTLPLPPTNPILPPITLGQDLDLTNLVTSPSIPDKLATQSANFSKYDLNQDGMVNSLDAGTLYKNLGLSRSNNKADLNNDGIIDQKDVEALNQFIARPPATK